MRTLTWAVAVSVLAGCGPITPQAFCEQFFQETCNRVERCSDISRADCEAQIASQRAQCETATEEDLCGSTGTFNPGMASQCLSSLQTVSCSGSVTAAGCGEICG